MQTFFFLQASDSKIYADQRHRRGHFAHSSVEILNWNKKIFRLTCLPTTASWPHSSPTHCPPPPSLGSSTAWPTWTSARNTAWRSSPTWPFSRVPLSRHWRRLSRALIILICSLVLGRQARGDAFAQRPPHLPRHAGLRPQVRLSGSLMHLTPLSCFPRLYQSASETPRGCPAFCIQRRFSIRWRAILVSSSTNPDPHISDCDTSFGRALPPGFSPAVCGCCPPYKKQAAGSGVRTPASSATSRLRTTPVGRSSSCFIGTYLFLPIVPMSPFGISQHTSYCGPSGCRLLTNQFLYGSPTFGSGSVSPTLLYFLRLCRVKMWNCSAHGAFPFLGFVYLTEYHSFLNLFVSPLFEMIPLSW